MMGRHADAARAYAHLYELSGRSAALAGDYGEALVQAAGGRVAPDARVLFAQVLDEDPRKSRARFYLGAAPEQDGQHQQAVAMWHSLEADAPPDASWLPAHDAIARAMAAAAP